MSLTVKNIIRFAVFILFQALILNKIPPLHRFIVPYLYCLYILWLPFNMNRSWLMIVAFLFGLSLDYFTGTPGLHAAPCVLIAYIRPFLINVLIRQEDIEAHYSEPSVTSMGWAPYLTYIVLLILLHHAYLVLIEWLQFGNILYFLGKVIGTTVISMLLILIVELLFYRKKELRKSISAS